MFSLEHCASERNSATNFQLFLARCDWNSSSSFARQRSTRSTPTSTLTISILLSNGSTFVPTKLLLAGALAVAHTTYLEIVHLVEENAPEGHRRAESYLNAVFDELIFPARSRIIETDDPTTEATRSSQDADIVLTRLDLSTLWRRV